MPDHILSSRSVYTGWLNLRILTVRLGEEDSERPIIEHPSGSAVLVYDPARRVALTVRQTRTPVLYLDQSRLAEPVAGVGEDESAADTAKREAEEEVGIRLREVERVGLVWITPASSTERVHLFLAEYGEADRVSAGGGAADENERIQVREEPLAALWSDLESGMMTDAKLFMLLQALRIRRPELFDPA
jgi:nudix-type nucleoside diphosphatase (YffH/AdpP family)